MDLLDITNVMDLYDITEIFLEKKIILRNPSLPIAKGTDYDIHSKLKNICGHHLGTNDGLRIKRITTL
jgi:hypothetical protein